MKGSYSFTEPAKADLRDLFRYGVETWGAHQADHYYSELIGHFEIIATDPMRFPAVSDIVSDGRRSVFRSHSVYFRIKDDAVQIIGIIRSQDVRRLRN